MQHHSFWGMDVEHARRSAADLRGHSAALADIIGNIGGLLEQLKWEGPVADSFRASWANYAPHVVKNTSASRECGRQLAIQARKQEDASRT